MPVRGTQNYVWFTEQPIGTGATGKVFSGRHKKLGDVCAIKVFDEHSRATTVESRLRELELVKKLSHKNIILLLAIEQETHTKENVLIMELCTEGSVNDMLQRPEHFYGFFESEFLIFFQDFVSGMEYLQTHGITHRDIKPGNILCSVGEDERSVYKLTDFCSAREEMMDLENLTSIQGTEEYLHPDVYGRVFMGKDSNRQGYNAAMDLWSIGATLYHVATGKVPFQPHGGRHNKETMFKILSEKKSEHISGVQKERNGDIMWSQELPDTCKLSVSLKKQLVPIILGTMQCDPSKQWSFEKFFKCCQTFVSLQRIHFFSGLSLQLCPLYVQKSSSVEAVKKEVESITHVPPDGQMWFYDTEDLCGSSEISYPPSTTEDNFIIFWSKLDWVKLNKPTSNIFLEAPTCNLNAAVLATDVAWSREVCAQIIHYSTVLMNLLRSQSVFILIKETLCMIGKRRLVNYRLMFSEQTDTFKALQLTGNMLFGKASEGGASPIPVSNDQLMIGKLERLERHIRSQFNEFDEDCLSDFSKQTCDCELKRCEAKLETYVNQAKTTYEQFKKDSGRTLSYNEEQIHKYDKIKLNEALKKSIRLLNEHCRIHTLDQHRKLIDWYCNEFKRCSDRLAHIEKDLKKFKAVCAEVFASIKENSKDLFSSLSENELPSSPTRVEMQLTNLSSTSVTKNPSHELKLHLDLISISQEDNLRMQKDIESHLREFNDMLNRLQSMRSGDTDIT